MKMNFKQGIFPCFNITVTISGDVASKFVFVVFREQAFSVQVMMPTGFCLPSGYLSGLI